LSGSIEMFERAIESQLRVEGPGALLESHALLGIAETLRSRGDFDQALQKIQATVEMRRSLIGTSHDDYAQAIQAYGETQLELGNVEAAGPALTEALAIYRRGRVEGHYEIAVAQIGYALLLLSTGKAAEAEKETREAIAIFQKVYPAGHRTLAAAQSALGESLLLQGKHADAEPMLVDSLTQLGGTLHYDRRLAVRRLIKLYELKGDLAQARRYKDELAAVQQQARTH
jgi:eukaryotic-like serine/threonine-protein kinase